MNPYKLFVIATIWVVFDYLYVGTTIMFWPDALFNTCATLSFLIVNWMAPLLFCEEWRK